MPDEAAESSSATNKVPYRGAVALLTVSVGLGAFLLFQVQPLAGKIMLPWFGGVPAVWAVCMLFFQGVLLAGYAYAHVAASRLKPMRQARWQIVILLLSLAWLPPVLSTRWQPSGAEQPALHILALLLLMVGGPFFILSTTAPLMQAWFSAFRPGKSPYRLYALSNTGSLLALLSYPLVIEPYFSVRRQAWIWSGLFAVYVLCAAGAAWRLRTLAGAEQSRVEQAGGAGVSLARQLLWFVFPLVSCVLLLAATNEITQDVAVVPFFWLLPLTIYLLSFILCFEGSGWYLRAYYFPLCAACLVLLQGTMWVQGGGDVVGDTIAWSLTVFSFCMVCHGELERAKPEPALLTRYYLLISAGGAAGGLFVSILAPQLFDDYRELPWALAIAAALPAFTVVRSLPGRRPVLTAVLASLWLAAAAALGLHLDRQVFSEDPSSLIAKSRNFYGTLRVTKREAEGIKPTVRLAHGRIIHGLQYTDPKISWMHIGYMGSRSGPALAVYYHPKKEHRRFGVLGLGTGTVAAFAGPTDVVRFYEINPLVVTYAQQYFTYLRNAKAKIDIVEGDGRTALANESPQNYDFLFLDAFSGDSPPVHLLTEEAFQVYLKHLAPEGAIFAQISNRYVDFAPLLWKMADRFGMQALLIRTPPDAQWSILSSSWIIMTNNQHIINGPEVRSAAAARYDIPGLRLWTDDYSSLMPLLIKD